MNTTPSTTPHDPQRLEDLLKDAAPSPTPRLDARMHRTFDALRGPKGAASGAASRTATVLLSPRLLAALLVAVFAVAVYAYNIAGSDDLSDSASADSLVRDAGASREALSVLPESPVGTADIAPSPVPPSGKPQDGGVRDVTKDAQVTVEVSDDEVENGAQRLLENAQALGGYAVSYSVSTTLATMDFKVPSDRLERLMAQTSALGTTLERSQNAQDITDQINATQRSLSSVQKRIDAAQRRLAATKDRSLRASLRSELEFLRDERNAVRATLGSQRGTVAYSDLSVTLQTRTDEALPVDEGRFGADDALSAAGRFWVWLSTYLLLAAVTVGPLAAAALVARRVRRGRHH